MTQAFNLSQLANFVNSSGQLDGSTGVVNAVPSATTTTNIAGGTKGQVAVQSGAGATTFIDSSFALKNRIINGAMVIDQRWAGGNVTDSTATNPYLVDRWSFYGNVASKVSLQQNQGSGTLAVGFSNYMGMTVTSAYTPSAGDAFRFQQIIEGYNIADLSWGTANAKTVTVSFWAYSSLTGTHSGALSNSALDRSYPFTFTISSANTWEYKTVTIAGCPDGTWNTTNSGGIRIFFNMGCGSTTLGTANAWANAFYAGATGSVTVVANASATFRFTGVQLEKGSTATSFDSRPYSAELAMCQRYAIVYGRDQIYNEIGGTGFAFSTTQVDIPINVPVAMRTTPSVTLSGSVQVSDGASATAVSSITLQTNQSSTLIPSIRAVVASGLTAFRPYRLETANSTSAYCLFSAEL